jgi:hypothetical protein
MPKTRFVTTNPIRKAKSTSPSRSPRAATGFGIAAARCDLHAYISPIRSNSPTSHTSNHTSPLANMRFLTLLTALASFAAFTMAQEAPVAPKMTLLYSMNALLGDRFSLGPIPTGDERIVIPIVGGTFEGPRMNGTSQVLHVGEIYPTRLPHITLTAPHRRGS